MSAGILGCVGLDELIAADEADYVDRATALASNPDRLRDLRRSLRDRVAASPLCDGAGFTADMEQVIRTMWCAWVDERAENV